MKRRVLGINVGTISIVLIFTVLCLTIFSVLTMVSARNELKLAKRAAQSSRLYYDAELLAGERLRELETCIVSGVSLPFYATSYAKGSITYIAYSVEIDAYRSLNVALKYQDGVVTVILWRTAVTGEWSPASYLDFYTN